ncbi:hypothetical protein D0T85_17520 [Bacteroides sp. 519]|nr:hypothetical protein [Bacteroides sp. 519]
MSVTLKYPLILVHGIAAKDNTLFWGRIPSVLKRSGVNVFWGNMDSWGNIETNAQSLQKSVDAVLNQTGASKVNIIAHSKGGIDARYLISSLGYANKIASLTTVSTPHRGVEIVDYILGFKQIQTPLARKIAEFLAKLYGDKAPNPYGATIDLSTKSMKEFNLKNPDSTDVYYCSCCAVLKNSFDDLSYFLTYNYIKKVAGHNDGIISAQSAEWGENFYLIHGASHAEIVDIKRKSISGLNIPGEYMKMVEDLISKGF